MRSRYNPQFIYRVVNNRKRLRRTALRLERFHKEEPTVIYNSEERDEILSGIGIDADYYSIRALLVWIENGDYKEVWAAPRLYHWNEKSRLERLYPR